MCGIAGFYGSQNWDVPPPVVLDRMVRAIRHRGPDATGTHVEGPVGLGHARLSIIDLSGGGQPMSDAGETVWVTFNGEIFNYIELKEQLQGAGHSFRTTSDTEVIVEAYREYGPDCVRDFNGDFAFALWDKTLDRLVIARDRMGVRPVYYSVRNGTLLFASEVKSLLEVPGVRAELDPVGLCQVFTFWHPVAPRTVFKNILELPPGHLLIADRGGVRVRPYWQPQFPAAGDPGPARSED